MQNAAFQQGLIGEMNSIFDKELSGTLSGSFWREENLLLALTYSLIYH